MGYIEISIRVILFSMLFAFGSPKSFSQAPISKEIIGSLYDIGDDSAKSYLNGNSIFIIVTNKSCIKCFSEACNYIAKQYKQDYKVYGVIMMPKNYLALIPTAQKYKDEIPCVTDFFFYFINPDQKEEIKRIWESPSPQLIIKNEKGYYQYSYNETLRMIERK